MSEAWQYDDAMEAWNEGEPMFEPCPTCGGSGYQSFVGATHHGPFEEREPCPACVGGRVVSESVIEEMADAMYDLPYDTLELRNWGEASVNHPARLLAQAAARVVLEHMEDSE